MNCAALGKTKILANAHLKKFSTRIGHFSRNNNFIGGRFKNSKTFAHSACFVFSMASSRRFLRMDAVSWVLQVLRQNDVARTMFEISRLSWVSASLHILQIAKASSESTESMRNKLSTQNVNFFHIYQHFRREIQIFKYSPLPPLHVLSPVEGRRLVHRHRRRRTCIWFILNLF